MTDLKNTALKIAAIKIPTTWNWIIKILLCYWSFL